MIILLIVLGVLSRVLPHMQQFTAMLAVAFLAGLYLRGINAVVVPLAMMVISDCILGFHNTMFFTWGSMVLISLVGLSIGEKKNLAFVAGGSFLSSVIFYLVTNFGAWLTLYPASFDGLRECYFLAIPFFRTTLVSTMAYSIIVYAGYEWVIKPALMKLELKHK